MSKIPNSDPINHIGGQIGVLLIHGFLGTPLSVKPWAQYLIDEGFSVSVPLLPGHGTSPDEMNKTTWEDWYGHVEGEFLKLKERCERVFVAGFSMGGALALRLSQIRGSEIEGTILLNASIYDERKIFHLIPIVSAILPTIKGGASDVAKPNPPIHTYDRIPLRALNSLRKLWKLVEEDLYLVDLPLMVAYSVNDHVVHPVCSETIIDNIFSVDIREVIFEKSFHNVSLDYESDALNDETLDFIRSVLSGDLTRGESFAEMDERELIDAEFESIVSGLSLDESSPTTYLDELDARKFDPEGFIQPNPKAPKIDRKYRAALTGIIGGLAYLALESFTGFDFIGLGPWPGILGFIGGVATYIWRTARPENNFDEGVEL